MSDTNPNLEKWKELAQHWRFSSHTSFRVQEHLESARGTWCQVSRYWQSLDQKHKDASEPIQFVRHALLSQSKEGSVPENVRYGSVVALAQFAQSKYLHALQGCSIDGYSKRWVEQLPDHLEELLRLELWDEFLDRSEKPLTEIYGTSIDFDLLRRARKTISSTTACFDDVEENFRLVTSLYILFSAISHVGFLAHSLSRHHFKDVSASGASPDNIVGYFMKMAPDDGSPHRIIELWRLSSNRDAFSNPPCVNLLQKPEDQSVEYILGVTADDAEKDKFRDIMLNLYKFFNRLDLIDKGGSKQHDKIAPSSRSEGIAPQRNEYQLVVPVYAWSEAPDVADVFRRRAGALLGWAFHRFREPMPSGWPTDEVGNAKQNRKHQKHAAEMGNHRKPCPCQYCQEERLLQHARSFSLIMEDFAVNYLAGETEWALEQDWVPGDTPGSYMKKNFHHSCGWTCHKVNQRDMTKYVDRCTECKDDGCATCLRVNLDRHLPTKAARTSGSSMIAHLRPNRLCLSPSDSHARKDYLASIAEKARHFYARCLSLDAKRAQGQVEEKRSHFFATTHELKDLVPLIPKAARQPLILRALHDLLFLFSLPAAGKLTENDKPHFPPEVYGCHSTRSKRQRECNDYREWLTCLVPLAARAQILALVGRKALLLIPRRISAWERQLVSRIEIQAPLSTFPLPADFRARCYLGVSILCAIRNALKHSFGYNQVFRKNRMTDIAWIYKHGSRQIVISKGSFQNAPEFSLPAVEIRNPYTKEEQAGDGTGGTQSAIRMFLDQIQQIDGQEYVLPLENGIRAKTYFYRLPLLSHP
ncbi:MAG TPA: hypothetical protein PLX89_04820 [Verrucomicrobiota bacterium]|nr:hypothetical protein [Verrucomicrobiota bacterium]